MREYEGRRYLFSPASKLLSSSATESVTSISIFAKTIAMKVNRRATRVARLFIFLDTWMELLRRDSRLILLYAFAPVELCLICLICPSLFYWRN